MSIKEGLARIICCFAKRNTGCDDCEENTFSSPFPDCFPDIREDTDQILSYLKAEIGKMENPYNSEDECSLYTGYGQFRQDILKLLEE